MPRLKVYDLATATWQYAGGAASWQAINTCVDVVLYRP